MFKIFCRFWESRVFDYFPFGPIMIACESFILIQSKRVNYNYCRHLITQWDKIIPPPMFLINSSVNETAQPQSDLLEIFHQEFMILSLSLRICKHYVIELQFIIAFMIVNKAFSHLTLKTEVLNYGIMVVSGICREVGIANFFHVKSSAMLNLTSQTLWKN